MAESTNLYKGVGMFLKTATLAVKKAGEIQKEYFEKPFSISSKSGNEIDVVTEIDMLCEKEMIKILKNAFPGHSILAEESGDDNLKSDYRWVIDPLDGTTNYSHGFPFFCSAAGLEHGNEIIAGAVFNPLLNELFTAEKGKGAYLNGRPIKISDTPKLGKSLLCTGFPYDIRTSTRNNLDNFKRFAVNAQAVRRSGSAALELCYLATGRFDGFWELKLKPWDTAAATLIVREAGGLVTDFQNNPYSIAMDELLASNGKIHEDMLKIMNDSQKK